MKRESRRSRCPQQLKTKNDATIVYIDKTVHERLDDLRASIKHAPSVEALAATRVIISDMAKALSKNDVAVFSACCRGISKLATKSTRSVDTAVVGEKPLPPLLTILMNMTNDSTNDTHSLFEAKGGLRAASIGVSTSEKFEAVLASPPLRKAMVTANKQIKGGSDNVLVARVHPR